MPKNNKLGRDANRPANKAERVQAETAEKILRAAGLDFYYERGKHLCIVVGGRRLALACTPRNEGDAISYTRQGAARIVRELAEGAKQT